MKHLKINSLEYFLLGISLCLIVAGLIVPTLDEASYLNAKRQIQSDYYIRKSKLEEDRFLGLLPESGINTYYNQSWLLENEYKYNLAKIDALHNFSSLGTIGNMITSIGFWALPTSLIIIAIINKELSEKQKVALIIGAFVLFIFVAYGLYTITFDLSIQTRFE